MPSPFGQSSDYSGVFSSLGREQINEIATATRQAANQASTDQNAADQDTYSKWKAGQISDEQWLAYIRQRLDAAGGDPTEQQKWADMLRTNEAAISDSQVETQFKLGKISAAALLSHYRKRMTDVATNSPAYRDLAERYQQVVDYSRGGSGGSGGGGGGSGASLAKYIASQQGKGGGPGAGGYDQSGGNIIDPAVNYYGVGSVSHYIKTIEADRDRIKDMMDQYKQNPNLEFVVDHMTNQRIPVTAELMHALDNQYLRTDDTLAVAYDAKGDPKAATAARTDKGTYISTYMVDHNTDNIEPAYSAFQKTIVDALRSASGLPPSDRIAVNQQIGKMIRSFEDGSFPGEAGIGIRAYLGQNVTNKATQEAGVAGQAITAELPPELQKSAAFLDVLKGWDAWDQAANNSILSDEERQFYADEAIRLIPGSIDPTTNVATRGERSRLSKEDVTNIIYGNPNSPAHAVDAKSQFGLGFTGTFATLEQVEGLDNRDPSYDGQRFVHSLDAEGIPHVVPAKSWPNVDGSITLTPLETVDKSSLIQTAFKVGATTHIGYATAQPIPANLLPQAALVYRATEDIDFDERSAFGIKYGSISAGGLIPSDVIKAQGGMGWLRQVGAVADSSFRGVVIRGENGPIIWYQDPKTQKLSTTLPGIGVSQVDEVTGGLHTSMDEGTRIVQADLNDVPFATGSPIAFGDGFSRKEMIAVTRNQIMSGQLDPTDFGMRGAGIEASGVATADDLIQGFGPPSMEELGQATMAQHNAWGRGHAAKGFDTQAAKDAAQWMGSLTAARSREGQAPSGMNPVQDVVDSISDFTSQMGVQIRPTEAIDLGGRQAPAQQADLGAMARNDALDAMRARQAAMNRPKPGGLQPIFTPPPVEYAPLPVRKQDTGAPFLPKINPTPVVAAPKVEQVKQGRYKGKSLGGY